jgi:hypothetical protein
MRRWRRLIGGIGIGCALLIGLAAVAEAGVGQLTLTWTDNATNEDGYKVERASGSCTPTPGTFAEIAGALPPNTVTYVDAGLGNGVTFCYRVRAYNAAGNSGYSNLAGGTTVAVPGAPTNLQISFLDRLDALLGRWHYVEGTTG